jgi:hypothetical protein
MLSRDTKIAAMDAATFLKSRQPHSCSRAVGVRGWLKALPFLVPASKATKIRGHLNLNAVVNFEQSGSHCRVNLVGGSLRFNGPYPVVLRRVKWKFQTKQIDCVGRLSERFGWLAASLTTEQRRH